MTRYCLKINYKAVQRAALLVTTLSVSFFSCKKATDEIGVDFISKGNQYGSLVVDSFDIKTYTVREDSLKIGDIVIDRDEYVVYKAGEKISLPRKEFELFSLLTSRPGKVFKREVILDTVWGNEVVVGGRTIDVHIRKLREKIGDNHFKTVKGVGYKFVLLENEK